ncbi:hypothetical protein J5Y09_24030 [Roseomonas sp. PWR1]|uniref:Uncharacterized protein n=1 Tax=Roseomonas nitratireducens TaxID=2820810 RepID=A0ABS4B075_9PROT|nr:hypothetical protein [Neoroseomonas nitratireducens]MBP0467013.1 hypothetical protein [Neoroseomonas nitratireducens]
MDTTNRDGRANIVTRDGLKAITTRDAPGATERAISVVHTSEGMAVHSDQPGAKVEVSQDKDGVISVVETLADGKPGETLTIPVVVPPAEAEAKKA